VHVEKVSAQLANATVVANHYLHRKTSISYAYGLFDKGKLVGVVTFGTPPSRHLQMSACPTNPKNVIELNRLWVCDSMPKNTESWFVSRALKLLPPKIVVSYADTKEGHLGYIYRALNFNYAGWTDMDRKTPRWDYIPTDPTKHSRDACRNGVSLKVRRQPKVRYWTVTGTKNDRRYLSKICGWGVMDWKTTPPPTKEDHGANS